MKLKLITKLQWGFGIPTALLVLLGIFSIVGFNRINAKIGTIYDDRVVPLKDLKAISDDYAINIIDATNKAADNRITFDEALRKIQDAQIRIEDTWEEYQSTKLTDKEKQLVEDTERLFTLANEQIDDLIKVLQRRNNVALQQFDGDLYDVIDPLTAKINDLIELQLEVAGEERQSARGIYITTLWFFSIFSIAAVITVIGPIRIIINRALIAALKDTINVVASASSEIATASEEQEKVAESQASSVNRTTTTMDELQASSQQSSQQAEMAAMGAQQVLNLSSEGNKVVQETLHEMSDLKQKVTDIAQAITQLSEQLNEINIYQELVGDIANQTDMLALNAAVEAVRAGEHGKGFGVVATEIRKLADQSKQSADKINQLVNDIQMAVKTTVMTTKSGTQTVEKGVSTVQKTAATFNNVSKSIEEVVINVQQISLNVKQQAIAVNEVVKEMATLNQAANQTASGVSETKVGTQKLSETALQLQSMV